MTERSTVVADGAVAELRQSLAGDVVTPADAGYDAARRCFNALIDRRPVAIARCLGPQDVATAFDFARTHALEVAVRGGGHNPAGHCVLDDGLVIDLSRMRGVEVDGAARVARSQGGATWLDFDAATQEHGLVTPGGVVGSTGVTGLTFGGGIGHLTALHGLTCDTLLGAELVTPDGSVVRAGPDGDAELLWALRGGGGNFGVATRLEFRLHPLERVVGGRLTYAGSGVRDVLRRFRDVVAGAPRELGCQAVLELDESSSPVLAIFPCYTGTDADPPELRALRGLPGLVEDAVRELPFVEQQNLFDDAYGEERHYWKGHFVRELPDELIDALLERISAIGRPPGGILIESLHGAPKDVDRSFGALGYREAAFNVSAMATWRDASLDELHIALGSRDGGGDRAVGARRRVRQLHGARRAARAGPCRVRRRGVRAPPEGEGTLRPRQRAAPEPEHPTADPVSVVEIETPHGLAKAHVHGVEGPPAALVLGHGAAGGVTAPDLVAATDAARAEGFAVALVEQPYRVAGRRSPAPPGQLDAAWIAVVEHLVGGELQGLPLVVGGRSLGARVACRTAAETDAIGVLCLAFPLQPRRKANPPPSRLPELDAVTVPTLVVQGERDQFGIPPPASKREVVVVRGDHGLKTDLDAVSSAVGVLASRVARSSALERLERSSPAALDLEEPEEQEGGGGVRSADPELRPDEVAHITERRPARDLPRRLDPVRERHRSADRLEPVRQRLDRDVHAADEEHQEVDEVRGEEHVARAKADRAEQHPERRARGDRHHDHDHQRRDRAPGRA